MNSLGLLRSAKPLSTEVLAQALVRAAKRSAAGLQRLKGQEVAQFVQSATT